MDDESIEKPPMIRDLDSLHPVSISRNTSISSQQPAGNNAKKASSANRAMDDDDFDF